MGSSRDDKVTPLAEPRGRGATFSKGPYNKNKIVSDIRIAAGKEAGTWTNVPFGVGQSNIGFKTQETLYKVIDLLLNNFFDSIMNESEPDYLKSDDDKANYINGIAKERIAIVTRFRTDINKEFELEIAPETPKTLDSISDDRLARVSQYVEDVVELFDKGLISANEITTTFQEICKEKSLSETDKKNKEILLKKSVEKQLSDLIEEKDNRETIYKIWPKKEGQDEKRTQSEGIFYFKTVDDIIEDKTENKSEIKEKNVFDVSESKRKRSLICKQKLLDEYLNANRDANKASLFKLIGKILGIGANCYSGLPLSVIDEKKFDEITKKKKNTGVVEAIKNLEKSTYELFKQFIEKPDLDYTKQKLKEVLTKSLSTTITKKSRGSMVQDNVAQFLTGKPRVSKRAKYANQVIQILNDKELFPDSDQPSQSQTSTQIPPSHTP